MRAINLIVVHCSATGERHDIGVVNIREWHKARGMVDIGYHYVIRRDGTVEQGRPESEPGAHAVGYNHDSLGICLVGGVDADNKAAADFNYSRAQMRALEALLDALLVKYPASRILGHRDLPGVVKACPCFDVRAWWSIPPRVA